MRMLDIEGYEGQYGVTEDGKVWSYKSKKYLAQTTDRDGYKKVGLYKNGKQKSFQVHRLVAMAFIPNPEGKETVNHKDEVKDNNNVDNLEWMTITENNRYGTRTQRIKEKNGKKVRCVELGIVFDSETEAAKALNGNRGDISRAARKIYKTSAGYHWEVV